jgi:hypothetical protein
MPWGLPVHAQMIMEAARLKDDGKVKKLVVTGCMAQRYSQELAGSWVDVCREGRRGQRVGGLGGGGIRCGHSVGDRVTAEQCTETHPPTIPTPQSPIPAAPMQTASQRLTWWLALRAMAG